MSLMFTTPATTTFSINEAKAELARTVAHITAQRKRTYHSISNEPILYLAGAPGIGKTMIVRQAAEDNGYALFTLIGASLLAEDVGGQPVVTQRNIDGNDVPAVVFSPSMIVQEVWSLREQQQKPVVLFFDEASRIAPDVQAPLLSFIQFRGLHGAYLPDDTIIIMAGNREDDDGGGVPLLAPMINRVHVLNLHADPKEWVRWASSATEAEFPTELHPLIAATIMNFPGQTSPFNFDPANGSTPFGSPRSWEAVNEYIVHQEATGQPCDVRRIASMVGPQNAAVLAAQAKFLEKLVPAADILADPMKVPVHEDATVAFLQFLTLTKAVKTVAHVNAAIDYALRPDPKNAKSTVPKWTMALGLFGDGMVRAIHGTPDPKDKDKRVGGIKDPAVHNAKTCRYLAFLKEYGIGGAGLMSKSKALL